MNQETNLYETGLGFTAGSSTGVELSFPTNRLNWYNGQKLSMSQDHVPQTSVDKLVHYGGWYIDNEYLNPDAPIPPNFEAMTLQSDSGKEFNVFGGRYIDCIPLLSRIGWWEPSKSTYQVLVALFDRFQNDQKQTVCNFIGYGILQAKGKGGTEGLQSALNSWPRLTANIRREHFPNYDPWVFIMPLGTFGTKRIEKVVNKSYSSKVVVCQVVPDGFELKAENLTSRLVPKETLEKITSDKVASQEWADDWNKKSFDDWKVIQEKLSGDYQPQNQQGQGRSNAPEPPPNFMEDDIPF